MPIKRLVDSGSNVTIVTARKFREKFLVTKLDKCLLGNSFIKKMKYFDWKNFLTNSSELECNQINDTKAKLEELKNEFSDIFN